MLNINSVKAGMSIITKEGTFLVVNCSHSKSGRGQAHVKAKLKNWNTGAIITHTFSGKEKVDQAIINKQTAQYIYNSGEEYIFLNQDNFEEISINIKQLLWEQDLLLEGESMVEIILHDDKVLGISLPPKVSLKIEHTEPAIKGDTVSGATKKATLESGLEINVPLFIKIGDQILISTEDKKYYSKDKK